MPRTKQATKKGSRTKAKVHCTFCGRVIHSKRVEFMGRDVRTCVSCQEGLEKGKITLYNREFYCRKCGRQLENENIRDVTGSRIPIECS